MHRACMLTAAASLFFFAGCSHQGIANTEPDASSPDPEDPLPMPSERDVDLLFVIDNSGSMANGQANARLSFAALTASLRGSEGGMPNVHLGVTTTDLGTGMFPITYCEDVGGDAGNLVTGNCTNPTGGAPYIIDVAPKSCDIVKAADNICAYHTCSQVNCAAEPTTTFVEDSATGCPRCRNYAGESLEDVFSCIGNLGTLGCGFEQPLEAMRKSLDPANTANTGFIRDSALLTIVLLTDEDDCSAADPQLFDNSMTTLTSALGPLNSYRCFEFGTTCDINTRTHLGTRQNCVPREDIAALLHPISRYVQFLQALKDPQMLMVAAIAGPVSPSPSGLGHDVEVILNDNDDPDLQYSCDSGGGNAIPGIRLYNFVAAFNGEEDLTSWAYSPICAADHTPVMASIGDKIAATFEPL